MSEKSPVDGVDLLLADLDGVVYRGAAAIPYAVESINRAASSLRAAYITNNASRTAASVADHLTGLGLRVVANEVVTSPQAAVRLLADAVPAGATVLVIGGEGLTDELAKAGFVITASAEESPAAVIQGFHPSVGWTQLAEASFALASGIPWIATNTDWTIPVARGIAPGNGTLVSAVHTAVGRLPTVAGKPETPIFTEAIERFGGQHVLFLGDRLDTDILGANRAGIDSALVLTGVDGAKQVLAADANSRPTYLLEDLRELHEPYPAIVDETHGDGERTVTVRDARVRIRGDVVSIESAGQSRIDLLRAGAATIWGSGRAIYGLVVPEALHSS